MNTRPTVARLFSLCIVLCLILTCNPGPGPEPGGAGSGQEIYANWRLSEIIRNGCDDANNNFRRPCTECHLLIMKTDGSYEMLDPDDNLIKQGSFRLINDEDITFDPSIFTSEFITSARYSLISGALKFDYSDEMTECAVTESYLLTVTGRDGD